MCVLCCARFLVATVDFDELTAALKRIKSGLPPERTGRAAEKLAAKKERAMVPRVGSPSARIAPFQAVAAVSPAMARALSEAARVVSNSPAMARAAATAATAALAHVSPSMGRAAARSPSPERYKVPGSGGSPRAGGSPGMRPPPPATRARAAAADDLDELMELVSIKEDSGKGTG